MDYFSKFLRNPAPEAPKPVVDHSQEFSVAWNSVRDTLVAPDERQLSKGIGATDVPKLLQSMVDSLVKESSQTEDGDTGGCLEYLLKNDVLGILVRLSENDRPLGIQAEVLRAVSKMVVSLDEQFLVHSVVHKAVLRLLRNCAGDDIQEQLDGKRKLMGAARGVTRTQPSEHEKDLVYLLFILCSRIRTYRELLMIFFHDKHWYRSEPLFSVEEEDEDDFDDDDEDPDEEEDPDATVTMSSFPPASADQTSSTSSQPTITSHQPEEQHSKKTEYEFLLFNYLLRFVHREEDIGEYARAGLLFLMEVAMSPREPENQPTVPDVPTATDTVNDAALSLAEYILDGDFSDVLGAGLNAVYSVLPSKLGFFPSTKSSASDNGMTIGGVYLANEDERERVLALSDKNRALGMEDARSPEFQTKIDHVLTLLVFLQEILRRNHSQGGVDASALVGASIVQSILDAVRRIFLENVLYPSILECSDVDGSAVAVMSYIDIMVRTLREGPLSNLLVDFLMSEDNPDSTSKMPGQSKAAAAVTSQTPEDEKAKKNRRRQSSAMALLEMEAPESRKQSDYFTSMGRFTLKDLLISNLKSQNQETATSALQLLQTMLLYYPQLTTERILTVIPDSSATAFPHPLNSRPAGPSIAEADKDDYEDEEFHYPGADDRPQRTRHLQSEDAPLSPPYMTYSTHEREMDLYLGLVSHFDPSHSDGKETFSTGYDHYLRDALLAIQSQPAYLSAFEPAKGDAPRFKHRLNVHDPVLSTILESLTTFFSNTPDFNVALTSILSTLATHPDRSVAGWITFALNDNQLPPASPYAPEYNGDGDDDRSIDYNIEEKLANETSFLPAVAMDDNSRPVVYTILQALVNQLERYRQTIDNFDKFLTERRQGLLFSENLSDALNLALDLTDEPRPAPVAPAAAAANLSPPQATPSKAKQSTTSSIVEFLTPKKSKRPKATPAEPTTPSKVNKPAEVVSTSPFGNHYHQTGSVKVDPFVVSLPSNSQWTSSKSKNWSIPEAEDDVFGSAWGEKPQQRPREDERDRHVVPVTPLTLSQLLDNVVILEEAIKEIVAIIHARRSLGIDSLRYL